MRNENTRTFYLSKYAKHVHSCKNDMHICCIESFFDEMMELVTFENIRCIPISEKNIIFYSKYISYSYYRPIIIFAILQHANLYFLTSQIFTDMIIGRFGLFVIFCHVLYFCSFRLHISRECKLKGS